MTTETQPNDLDAFWMPFTANRAFKKTPRIVARSKDMHYYTNDGRAIMDTTAGLWCCNAGHNRDHIVAAIQACVASTDLEPTGCPQRIYSYRAAPNTAAWSMPDLSPMKLESFSSYSMEVRFSGNLTFPVTYRTTSGDTKSDSDNALTWGKVDITQSPLRATFR